MVFDSWKTILHEKEPHWQLSSFQTPPGQPPPNVVAGTLRFGTAQPIQGGAQQRFLCLNTSRYRDVDVMLKLQILNARANTDWVGISTRALEFFIWSAYLFFIRQNGSVEFGMGGTFLPAPTAPLTQVTGQPVTLHIQINKDRIRTWANGTERHKERDIDKRFIRNGNIYLISWGTEANIFEVEVKVKRWYAQFLRLVDTTWKIILAVALVVSALINIFFGIPDLLRFFKLLE